jgi:hypothetical protein
MLRTNLVIGSLALLLGAPSLATADLGPAKPGDTIVAIQYLGDGCHTTGFTVNSMILPNGEIAPFAIPAGHAFMVTGVDFANGHTPSGVPTGARIGFILRTVSSPVVIAEGYAINTGAEGPMSGSATLSTPMRVSETLCLDRSVGSELGGTRTWIRGFLAKHSEK